jgi:hypothetical protein
MNVARVRGLDVRPGISRRLGEMVGSVEGDVVNVEEYYNVLQWPWQEGDTGIYFLHLKVEPNLVEPIYRLTSTQGRFDLGRSSMIASNDTYGWVKKLENINPNQFAAAVEDAMGA